MAEASYKQSDEVIDYTPSSAATSGQVVQLRDGRAGVVVASVAASEKGALRVSGLYDATAASGTTFSEGEEVFWDDTNNLAVPSGDANASFRLGMATVAKVSGETVVRTSINGLARTTIKVAVADGTTVTNTTTETSLGSASIPANKLKRGSRIRIRAAIDAPSTNSTDTFRYRVRLGTATGGDIIADTGAIDLANGDDGVIVAELVVRSDGASGTYEADSMAMLKTTAAPLIATGSIDTTAAQTINVTALHSVASASNQSVLKSLTVEVIG